MNESDSNHFPMVIFNESNPKYQNNLKSNLIFIRGVESICKELIRTNGYLTLNTVYKKLKFPETQIGSKFGWSEPTFELFNLFFDKYSSNVAIEFKPQGNILHLLPKDYNRHIASGLLDG